MPYWEDWQVIYLFLPLRYLGGYGEDMSPSVPQLPHLEARTSDLCGSSRHKVLRCYKSPN